MLASSKDIALEVNGTGWGHSCEGELKSSWTAQWAGEMGVSRDPDQSWEGGWGHSWAGGVYQVLEVNP